MLRSIKVRLYPNKDQEVYINKLLGSSRFVYNQCLYLKKSKYDLEKISLSQGDLQKFFHNDLTKNPDFIWLQEHNTKVLKSSIVNLIDAWGTCQYPCNGDC